MSRIVDPSLDHRKFESVTPTYRHSRLVANTGKTEFILQPASKTEIVWDLPVRPRNLPRTYLEADLVIGVPSGQTVNYNKVWTKGCSWLNQLEFRNRSGTQVTFVDNADQVYNALAPYCNRLEETKQHGTVINSTLPTNATSTQSSMYHRSNARVSDPALPQQPNPDRIVNGAHDTANVNDTEEQYFQVGADGAETVIHIRLPLSEFFDTFLAEEQDCFFEEIMQLRLNLNELTKVGFQSGGADAAAAASANGVVAPVSSAKLTNVFLMDCLEVDKEASRDIISLVQRGKTQRMPYMIVHNESINDAATQYNRQIKMNEASTGDRVLRICSFTTNGGESLNNNMDTNNRNVAGVSERKTSFFTSLNSLRLQEVDIECGSNGVDYDLMRPYLKDSCVQSRDHYNHSSVWSDSFDGSSLAHCRERDSVKGGLKMSGLEHTWAIQQKTPTGTNRQHYAVIVAQRTLSQQNGQILVA